MDQVTLEQFRCFRDKQVVRLAPLTLLVGENSSGKTSFLALIRALWDIAYDNRVPDFKEDPYDLGSFDEIAHHRGARGGRATGFKAGFVLKRRKPRDGAANVAVNPRYCFSVTFGKRGTIAVPVGRRLWNNEYWVDEERTEDDSLRIQIGSSKGSWRQRKAYSRQSVLVDLEEQRMRPLASSLRSPRVVLDDKPPSSIFVPMNGSKNLTTTEWDSIYRFVRRAPLGNTFGQRRHRPFASAPVRSRPHRTYDPGRPTPDPEGDYVPMYLASVYFQNKEAWKVLKEELEYYGQAAGLFDEISIKPLGRRDTEPFQLQIRKYGGKLKGPQRNLIDVGYGVSQVLPLLTELLRRDSSPMFLLQQPEVHLHPSAQAVLGSLFYNIASPRRQLIVETHSDHLLDRVRMDVRDRRGKLRQNDVSILFFERRGLDVRIHSLKLDREGNVTGAPNGYRRFFLEETSRSLGL